MDGQTVLPAGTIVSGEVATVGRVGLGLWRETARLELKFNRLSTPGGTSIPISTLLREVDNSRDNVNAKGRILGLRPTSGICYRVSGYVRTALQWEIHARIAVWAIRSFIIQMPEPEIYYPPGVELTLNLQESAPADSIQAGEPLLSAADAEALNDILPRLPLRTFAPDSEKASDMTNVVLMGSREQIEAAFAAAGWTEADPATLRTRIRFLRAASSHTAYPSAPMSSLLLDDAQADLCWQKSFNDVRKRHHIRIWKQPGLWKGQEVWVGAATRDIDFAFLRSGHKLTHQIEHNVDRERDKVAYDLEFTGCGRILDWFDRPRVPAATVNATGDLMTTDGRIVVVSMQGCSPSVPQTQLAEADTLPAHGGPWQRFLRRQIISFRSDLFRTNRYYRSYEGARWVAGMFTRRRRMHASEAEALREASVYTQPVNTAAAGLP